MRFYGFGNYYLSSLQQGLQAGHTISELFVKYTPKQSGMTTGGLHSIYTWARNHKTMVLLNGGNSKDLQNLYEFLESTCGQFPFAKFHEDEQSLNCALTYVGIILPSYIYDTAAAIRNGSAIFNEDGSVTVPVTEEVGESISSTLDFNLTENELELCQRLNMCGLAK